MAIEFRSQLAPHLLRLLRAGGVDLPALLARHRLPEDAPDGREVVLPLPRWHALSREAEELLGEPFLGLRIAQLVPRGAYGALEFTLRNAPDIRSAIERLQRYSSLINSVVVFALSERRKVASFRQWIPGVSLCNGRVGNEYSIAMVVRLAREVSGRPFNPQRVWFAHPRPADVALLREFFACDDLQFDAGENGFSFDAHHLDLPVATADPALLPVVEGEAKRLAAERMKGAAFPAVMRENLEVLLPTGAFEVKQMAKAMHVSSRTLQRRLAESGTTFNALVESVRQSLAREHLARDDLTLGEIAYLLGYSELSAFTRAFKRWTGKTPTEHRAGLRASGSGLRVR